MRPISDSNAKRNTERSSSRSSMVWSHMEKGRRNSGDAPAVRSKPAKLEEAEIAMPLGFRCPISLEIMKDPVILCTGITYDRQGIETWMDAGNVACPVSNMPLQNHDLIPNHALRRMIQNWCVENRAAGIERIPTPRIPTTRAQVTEILSEIEAASHHGGLRSITSGAKTILHLATESERNQRCVVGSDTGAKLAVVFAVVCERFAQESDHSDPEVAVAVESVLAAMTAVSPLLAEARSHLWSRPCMSCLAAVLQGGSLEGRGNAASVLREAMRDAVQKLKDGDNLTTILESTPRLVEELVRVVREPICPGATKASLAGIIPMTCASDLIVSRFVDLGLVPVLLEILPDCDRSVCEKALALLDRATASKEGRESASGHALSVPVVVKKMLRVSDAATNLAVSIMWRLCCRAGSSSDESVVVEALSMGLFQKFLLLLQMGCGDGTKTKATDLLRTMTTFKDRFECVDSWDFKNLKRPA